MLGVSLGLPGGANETAQGAAVGENVAREQATAFKPAPEFRLVSAAATAVPRIALVIGNASYPDDDGVLAQPVNDARAIAAELSARGFELTVGENLTRQGMTDTIAGFTAKVTPGSTALVFFSGYGIQAGRQSYLVPVNAQIWREADVRREAIAVEPILAELEEKGAAAKLLMIDASRRNPYERRFRGLSIGLGPIWIPAGTIAIYSTAPGSVARDGAGPMSLFARALISELGRDDASAEEVFNRTRREVARISQGERMPVVISSMTVDLFLPKPNALQAARSTLDSGGELYGDAAIRVNYRVEVSTLTTCGTRWRLGWPPAALGCAQLPSSPSYPDGSPWFGAMLIDGGPAASLAASAASGLSSKPSSAPAM